MHLFGTLYQITFDSYKINNEEQERKVTSYVMEAWFKHKVPLFVLL